MEKTHQSLVVESGRIIIYQYYIVIYLNDFSIGFNGNLHLPAFAPFPSGAPLSSLTECRSLTPNCLKFFSAR